MASFILKGLVTNDGIDRLGNANQPRRFSGEGKIEVCLSWLLRGLPRGSDNPSFFATVRLVLSRAR